jgi:glycogen debranching enzyme
VRGSTPAARWEARQRYYEPLARQLTTTGLGHLFEIADAQPPHAPRGCPFQAWSLGELLRMDRVILAEPLPTPPAQGKSRSAVAS